MSLLRLVEHRTNGAESGVVVVEGATAERLVALLVEDEAGHTNRLLSAPTREGAHELARALHEAHKSAYSRNTSPYCAIVDADYGPLQPQSADTQWRATWNCHEIENAVLRPDLLAAVPDTGWTGTDDALAALIEACRALLPLAAVNAAIDAVKRSARVHVRQYRLADRPASIDTGCAAKYSELRPALATLPHESEFTAARFRELADEYRGEVEPQIGTDAGSPVPPRFPGKEVLDLVRQPWGVARDDLVLRIGLVLKHRGLIPPELEEPLRAVGFLGQQS